MCLLVCTYAYIFVFACMNVITVSDRARSACKSPSGTRHPPRPHLCVASVLKAIMLLCSCVVQITYRSMSQECATNKCATTPSPQAILALLTSSGLCWLGLMYLGGLAPASRPPTKLCFGSTASSLWC
jgi:hypothetical protein